MKTNHSGKKIARILCAFAIAIVLLAGCEHDDRDTKKEQQAKKDAEAYEELLAKKPKLTAEEPADRKTAGSYACRTYRLLLEDDEEEKERLIKTETVVKDAEGRNIWECTLDQQKADNTEVEINAYRYDSLGRVVEQVWERHSEELREGHSLIISAYTYDGDSCRVLQRIEYEDESITVYDNRYNEQGDFLTQTSVSYTPNEDGELRVSRFERKREYDEYGNLIRLTETYDYLEEPKILVEYDEDEGKVIRYDGTWVLEDYYDEQGRMIRRYKYIEDQPVNSEDWKSSAHAWESYQEYSYNGDSRICAESREYDERNEQIAIRRFDREGRIVSERYWIQGGTYDPDYYDEYIFDWNATDPARPGKRVMRETVFSGLEGGASGDPIEESYYEITEDDPKGPKYYEMTTFSNWEYTCFMDYIMTGQWYTPDKIIYLTQYRSGSRIEGPYSGLWDITMDTTYTGDGKKQTFYEQVNFWEDFYEYDEHENPIKWVYTTYEDDNIVDTMVQIFEYEYY